MLSTKTKTKLDEFLDHTWLASGAGPVTIGTVDGQTVEGKIAHVISKGDRPEVVTVETTNGHTSVFVSAIATVAR